MTHEMVAPYRMPPVILRRRAASPRKSWSMSPVEFILNFSAIVVASITLILALRYLGASP